MSDLRAAIVQDAASGRVLMLAWMDAEAERLTRETGEAWFWSRSRQELWHKGETSGNVCASSSCETTATGTCSSCGSSLRGRPATRGPSRASRPSCGGRSSNACATGRRARTSRRSPRRASGAPRRSSSRRQAKRPSRRRRRRASRRGSRRRSLSPLRPARGLGPRCRGRRGRARVAPQVSAELDFALELADAADAISLPRFGARDLRVERKPDLTPVTDADRAIEQALRALVAERGEGFFGEEQGGDPDGVRWIVDPIDGTKNFVRGIPVWATLIALARDDVLVLGVVSAPALGRRWWAARGEGAFCNGARSASRASRSSPMPPSPPRSPPTSPRSRTPRGTHAGSATSGSTSSSPRARSTPQSTIRSSSGTTPRSSRSSRKPAAAQASRQEGSSSAQTAGSTTRSLRTA